MNTLASILPGSATFAALPALVLVGTAGAIAALEVRTSGARAVEPRLWRTMAIAGTSVAFALLAVQIDVATATETNPVDGEIAVDGLARGAGLMVLALGFAAGSVTTTSSRASLWLLATAMAVVVTQARGLATLVVALEGLGLASVGLATKSASARAAGFARHALASALLLPGAVLLHIATGETGLVREGLPEVAADPGLLGGAGLLTAGLLLRGAGPPSCRSTTVRALLAGACGAALLRLGQALGESAARDALLTVLTMAGTAAVLAGSLRAWTSRSLRGTVGALMTLQLGIVALAVGADVRAGSPEAGALAVTTVSLLVAVAGATAALGPNARPRGRGGHAALAVVVLSLAGLPPLPGFRAILRVAAAKPVGDDGAAGLALAAVIALGLGAGLFAATRALGRELRTPAEAAPPGGPRTAHEIAADTTLYAAAGFCLIAALTSGALDAVASVWSS